MNFSTFFNRFILFYIITIGLCIITNYYIQSILENSSSLNFRDPLEVSIIISFLIGIWAFYCVIYLIFSLYMFLESSSFMILKKMILTNLSVIIIIVEAFIHSKLF